MNKDMVEVLNRLKESIKRDQDFGKDEVVMLVCTAAIVASLDRINKTLDGMDDTLLKS
jgi:hypothetical protein